MPTEILISSDPWENRVAILENGTLAEIYIEREEKVIGSIYKGKVQNVLPGMGASFVDIGIGRNAFLYVDDINKAPLNIGDVEITQGRSGWTISEKVNRGDEVLVQIVKEPRGLKGARVSTNISLPGRYLILMPTGKFSGVSRKIESAEERNRLKNVMKRIRPDEMATIVRTAAAGVSDAELIADLGVLIRMWHGILENYKSMPAPSLVHKDMNLVFKAARDFITPEIDRVLVDNQEECEKLRDFMRLLGPQYVDRIQYYPQGKALFRDFKVDEEITKLMRPKVNLPSGGSLVIETTEALTVIDVNSGKYAGGKTHEDTILHTNLEAAAEIARQVRLRDIGGIVVCDFIDMNSEANRTKVLNVLENGLRRDRTRTTIQSFSALGLLEFTRKRVGKDLSSQLRASCPTCRGLGNVLSPETVTIETFRAVEHHHHHGAEEKPLSVVASPTVAAQIRYWHEDEIADLEKRTERKINLVVDAAGHPERTRVTADPSHLPLQVANNLRVGDELDVEILPVRMPSAGTGIALVDGRFIEIENASGAVGSTLAIRVIDIDDESGEILAEPRGPQANPERKRRRRKRGKSISPTEQAEELRELAEEAARIASITEQRAAAANAASEEKPLRAEKAASERPAEKPAHHERPQRQHHKEHKERFSRRRDQQQQQPHQYQQQYQQRQQRQEIPAEAMQQEDFFDPAPFYEDPAMQQPPPQRGTRFQPRGRRPGMRVTDGVSITPRAVESLEGDEEGDDEIIEGGQLSADAVPFHNDGQRRRRRRRRRGRGRGRGPGGQQNGMETGYTGAPEPGAIPNRSIFRVSSNGNMEPTGQVAPPEPSRALAPWRTSSANIAIDAPPPSLSAQEGPPLARPAARRRGRPPKNVTPAQLTTTSRPALPGGSEPASPAAAPVAQPVTAKPPAVAVVADAPKRRGRPPKSATAATAVKATAVTAEAAAPKRRGRPPKSESASPAAKTEKAPKAATKTTTRKAAAESTSKATTTRRKKSS